MSNKLKIILAIAAFALAALLGAVAATAFTAPATDPGAAGFSSPCSFALSKGDGKFPQPG